MVFTDAHRAFLDQPNSAVVATHRRDGTTVQSVVWYARDGETLWISCDPKSAKATQLRRDPRVSVLIFSADGRMYLSIEASATVTEDIETADRIVLMRPYMGEEGAQRAVIERPITKPNARLRIFAERVFAYNLPD